MRPPKKHYVREKEGREIYIERRDKSKIIEREKGERGGHKGKRV